MPYPWNDADPTSREFRQLSAAAHAEVNYCSYEGYLNALVLIEALRRTGRSLTRASLHSTMRAFKGRVGNLDLDFTAGRPTGSRYVDLVYVTTDARFIR